MLPRPGASTAVLRDLSRIVGAERVSAADGDRLAYARDCWTRDVLELRAGRVGAIPEVIVWPSTAEQVSQVLSLAIRLSMPVVPYGTGTGRMGGSRPSEGGIVLDMKRMKRVRHFSPEDLLIEVETGILGERLERWLNARAFTLGHVPSSMMSATVGGWLATGSVGHLYSRYGAIGDMVLGLETVTAGQIRRHFSGPRPPPTTDWNRLVLGSEGCLGVMTSVVLRIHEQPVTRVFCSYRIASITRGLECMRRVMRAGIQPSIVRLYDTFEFRGNLGRQPEEALDASQALGLDIFVPQGTMTSKRTFARRQLTKFRQRVVERTAQSVFALPMLLNQARTALSRDGLLLFAFDGVGPMAHAEAGVVRELVMSEGGEDLGPGPGQEWFNYQRHEVVFLAAPLFTAGLFVDLIDVTTTWDRLLPLYRAVKRAVSRDVLVTSSFTHARPEGCAIEFRFTGLAGDQKNLEDTLERYDRVLNHTLQAVHDAGGTIAHHQGVGVARAPGMDRELGVGGKKLLSAVATAFDRSRIMNPGKLGLTRYTPARLPFKGPSPGLPRALAAAVGARNVTQEGHKTIIRPPDEGALSALFRVANARAIPLLSDQSEKSTRLESMFVDLGHLDRIKRISERSLFVEVEAGVIVKRLESVLNAHGLTMGPVHPRARLMSVGAALAHSVLVRRSVGFGQLNDVCMSIRGVLPSGEPIETRAAPHASTGPCLKHLFVGGAGRFGWLVKATLRVVQRQPYHRSLRMSFGQFADAVHAMAHILRHGVRPVAARVWPDGSTGYIALELVAPSEELLAAQMQQLRAAAHKWDGIAREDTTFWAQAGRVDEVIEVELPWSTTQTFVRGIEWASWGDVWLDFMTPEAATIVVRAKNSRARQSALAYAQKQGGRILYSGSSLASSEAHSLYAFEDVARALARSIDPGHILS